MGFPSPFARIKRALNYLVSSKIRVIGRTRWPNSYKRYAKDVRYGISHRHRNLSLDKRSTASYSLKDDFVHTPPYYPESPGPSMLPCPPSYRSLPLPQVHSNVISLLSLTCYRTSHPLNEICKLQFSARKSSLASLARNLNSSFAENRRERVPKIFGASVLLC